MLNMFALSNYKSFNYDENYSDQYIELIPNDIRSKTNHVNSEGLLKDAVIFGSNAAGKSNLIDGLRFVKQIITKESLPKGSNVFYCRNDELNADNPISFLFQILVKVEDFIDENSRESLFRAAEHIVSPPRMFINYEISVLLNDGRKGFHILHESLDVSDGRDIIQYCSRDSPRNKSEVESEIARLKSEIRSLRDRISKLHSKLDDIMASGDMSDEDLDLMLIMNDPDDGEAHQIQAEIDDLMLDLESKNLKLAEESKKINHLRADQSFLSYSPDMDYLSRSCSINDSIDSSELNAVIKAVYHWFDYNLEIIDPYGFVLPELDTDSFVRISDKIREFDVGISRIDWVSVNDPDEVSSILSHLHLDELDRINKCRSNSIRDKIECSAIVGNLSGIFKISFWSGERSVKKLVTYHDSDKPHDLFEESDGTKRIIELSSILVNQPSDKVYVVDELDRRLHPLLTRRFMELFLSDDSKGSDNKQLIITTHESRILTTELFRADEIWFADRDEGGYSSIHRASDAGVPFDKRLDRIYLEDGSFGGIPHIQMS